MPKCDFSKVAKFWEHLFLGTSLGGCVCFKSSQSNSGGYFHKATHYLRPHNVNSGGYFYKAKHYLRPHNVNSGGYFHKAKHYLRPHNVNVKKTFTKTTNLN